MIYLVTSVEERPRFRRRLICLTWKADRDLAIASEGLGVSHSQTVRQALALLAQRVIEAQERANGEKHVTADDGGMAFGGFDVPPSADA